MKRFRLAIILCALLAAIGGLVAWAKKPAPDVFAPLKTYMTEDKITYFDPSVDYKNLPASVPRPPASALQPEMIRRIKLRGVTFLQVSELIHREFKPQDGWTYPPLPKMPPDFHILRATHNSSINPLAPLIPDHSVFVIAYEPPLEPKGGVKPNPPAFELQEIRRLSSWEVDWLKLKHLGHDPFANALP